MTIKTLTYRRLVSTGSYENEALEISVDITPDENPNEVFDRMKTWVERRLEKSRELGRVVARLAVVEQERDQLSKALDEADIPF